MKFIKTDSADIKCQLEKKGFTCKIEGNYFIFQVEEDVMIESAPAIPEKKSSEKKEETKEKEPEKKEEKSISKKRGKKKKK